MATPLTELLEEESALECILSEVGAASPEETPLADALGRYLAGNLIAQIPSPPFDCSAMDGYALAASPQGYPAGARFKIATGSASAGACAPRVEPGQALRIFTGAAIPEGTGAVVMQEDVAISSDDPPTTLELKETSVEGEFIRHAGADLCAGQLLIPDGSLLTPQRISAAASQGLTVVPCPPRSQVGILSTGDELIPPGSALPSGSIYNSNLPLLTSLVGQSGGNVLQSTHAGDKRKTLLQKGQQLLDSGCAILISCGGVSVGEHDHVRWMVEELGFESLFWGLRMRPGKPFLFARHPEGKWFFGLPGNPASAFVCFHRLVGPALRKRMGAAPDLLPPPHVSAVLHGAIKAPTTDRPHHLRGTLDRQGIFRPIGIQESHAISGLAACNALLRTCPGTDLREGATVQVTPV